MNLDRLQKIAEAATPGPWFAADWGVDDGPDLTTIEAHEPEGLLPPGYSSIWPGGVRCINVASTRAGSNPLPDAAYIAAVSPAVVLRLIAVARAAKQADDDMRDSWWPSTRTMDALRSALAELDATEAGTT